VEGTQDVWRSRKLKAEREEEGGRGRVRDGWKKREGRGREKEGEGGRGRKKKGGAEDDEGYCPTNLGRKRRPPLGRGRGRSSLTTGGPKTLWG
jgi:hypothetical protein